MKPPAAVAPYFPALTGFRAVAAFLVFFYHFNPIIEGSRPVANAAVGLLGAVLAQGHVGVTIFFVLSGFLIAIRYQGQVQPTWAWARQYLLNRFARIYPLYFLLTVCAFAAMLGHLLTWYTWPEHAGTTEILFATATNFTLLRGFFRSYYLLGVPTGWSLTVEMCFYLIAPVVLLVLRGRLGGLLLAALGLLALGAGIAQVAPHLPWYGSFMQPFSFVLACTFFGRCVEFLAGMSLAFWLVKRRDGPVRRGTTWLGAVLMAGCVAGMAVSSQHYQPTAMWPASPVSILINNFLLPVGIVTLFHGLIHEKTWFQKLLETSLFSFLGHSSYAFYLVHIGLFSDLLGKSIGQNSLVYFVVFNLFAILLYKLVERPLHLYVLGRFSRPAQAPEAAANR